MTALAALLAVALAAGPADAPRRTASSSNAARARAGLLPRKAARTQVEVRRLRTVGAPAPTYLGAPAPLADAPAEAVAQRDGRDEADAPGAADEVAEAPAEVPGVAARAEAAPLPAERAAALVPARGRVETVRLPAEVPAPVAPAVAAAPPRLVAPEELGSVRVALVGVSTDVTLRLRFDP